jgi:hypothetical protein
MLTRYFELFTGKGCFFEQFNGSSIIFLAFAMGETASPESSAGECGGGKHPTGQKPQKIRGWSVEVKRNIPCP